MTESESDDAWLAVQREKLTPEHGFALVGMDRISDSRGELYTISEFDVYKSALDAKMSRENPDEYLVLYRDADGTFRYR